MIKTPEQKERNRIYMVEYSKRPEVKARQKLYVQTVYREKKREQDKKWSDKNKERKAATDRAYREANKEKVAASKKAWGLANPDKVQASNKRSKEKEKQARRANPTKRHALMLRPEEERKADRREYARLRHYTEVGQAWKKANTSKIIAYKKKFRAKEYQARRDNPSPWMEAYLLNPEEKVIRKRKQGRDSMRRKCAALSDSYIRSRLGANAHPEIIKLQRVRLQIHREIKNQLGE